MDLFVLRAWLHAKFGNSERGASMIEYGLLVALIAVVAVVAFQVLGQKTSSKVSSAASSLS